MQAGLVIIRTVELVTFEFIDEDFACEELRAGKEMAAEDLSFCIAENNMHMDERFPVAKAHVAVEVQNFHPAGEFQRIVRLRVLIIKRNHRMRGRPEGAYAA